MQITESGIIVVENLEGIRFVEDPEQFIRPGLNLRGATMATRVTKPRKCPIMGLTDDGLVAILNSHPPNGGRQEVVMFQPDECPQIMAVCASIMRSL